MWCAVVGLVVLAAGAGWWVQRRAVTSDAAWQRDPTPPEGVIAAPAMSWAAGGVPNINSAALGRSVGYRVRTYGPTLAADEQSIIREL